MNMLGIGKSCLTGVKGQLRQTRLVLNQFKPLVLNWFS